ncbi:MAG: glycosyltransferase family 2 protein [Planctomycetota bacterium]
MSVPLSIGMPIYNAAAYLEEAIASLLKQTYGDFELIISDNRSTDASVSICRDLAATDSRISVVVRSENVGVCRNFNEVFYRSRGEYFKWAAGDDRCDPNYLSRCIHVLQENEQVVCCHSRTVKVTPSNCPRPDFGDPTVFLSNDGTRKLDASGPQPSSRFEDVLLSSGWGVRSYGVVRRTCLERTRLIQPYFGFEKVLMAELSLMGRFHDVEEVLFFQRIHQESTSSLATAERQQEWFAPETKRVKRGLPIRMRLFRGYLAAIRRSKISWMEKSKCFLALGKYLGQFGKWRSIIGSAGLGNSGDAYSTSEARP